MPFEEPAGAHPFQLPSLFGSSFNVSWSSNECCLLICRTLPALLPPEDGAVNAFSAPVAALHMSPQAAKDLCLLLMEGLSRYENDWGALETEFVRSRGRVGAPS